MSEDDTFLKLAQTPLREMIRCWMDSELGGWAADGVEEFFQSHHWDIEEFRQAWIQYNHGSPEV